MFAKATKITATITVSIAIGLLNSPLLAQPASIFSPIQSKIKRELPSGWVMRLPASNEHLRDLDAYAFNWNDMFAVQLTPPDCPATRGNVCIAGSIYISKYNSSEIESYQRARRQSYAPITLRSGIRGFYTSGQAATGVYHSVIWQQDNQIYRVTGRIGRSAVIDIALSMANQAPIEPL